MPSSVYATAFANHPEMMEGESTIWEAGDWFDVQSDGGLGDTITLVGGGTGMVQCPDGNYAAQMSDCPPVTVVQSLSSTPAQGYPQGCPPGTSPVDAGGNLPICLTAAEAVGYGKGIGLASQPSGVLGIPASAIPWLLGIGAVVLLGGALGGRRR